ncbi:MAG: GH32 C-terminal domain-containing protein [Planctomycetota bacterium]|jgi:fructan beta-fructosidase
MEKTLSIILTIFLTATVIGADEQKDILIADFEGKTYGDWKVEGEAFGPGPARGTLDGQMNVSGFEGKALVNTYYKGDETTGTLTSPPFKIQCKYINFLIGGGMHPGKACINLLLDGKVVRTATGPNNQPGGSEALDWTGWDVADLMGKKACIQIVDEQKGGWGHINIDHIFQSNEKVEEAEKDRTMRFTKRYLNLPVKHGAAKRLMDVLIDGKIVRQFVIELADDEPDYWVFLDIAPFRGKQATLRVNSLGRKSRAFKLIYQDNAIKEAKTFYREKNRQQFHFSSQRGWNNDTNGMVYYDGEFHMFWQHNPFGWNWGNMTWGHTVSKDMVHWKELGDAIHPDHLGTIFSGSAVVDEKNTADWQTGDEKVIVCAYTSAGGTNAWSRGQPFTQSMAYSNDRGRTWTVYEDNPVLGHINGSNRDPKVIWHKPTGRWVMVLYMDGGMMAFFSSSDLKSWTKHSELKCFHECPELFELPIDGDKNNKRWILYGGAGDYLIGDFDGKEFKPHDKAIRFQHGNCFYASQTFNNVPKSDGRRIQMAWARIATPGMPFNQCILFPVELTLHTTDDGIRMFAEPIREIENIHGSKQTWKKMAVQAGEKQLSKLSGELFHIKARFLPGDAKKFGFVIRGTRITYNLEKAQLTCRDKKAALKPVNGKIDLELLVDRNSIEIFANGGRVYMPIGGILPEDDKSIKLFSEDGMTQLETLDVWELRSIWR